MRGRDFLTASGTITASMLLAACGSRGAKGADRVRRLTERKNETLERALFRHTSMDSAGTHWKNAGSALPSYFISDTVPVWHTAARGAWTLEVSGLVQRPLKLLAPAHGAPARLYSPVKLGYKNTKYLTQIVFMPHRNRGYWSDQGYEWYAGTSAQKVPAQQFT